MPRTRLRPFRARHPLGRAAVMALPVRLTARLAAVAVVAAGCWSTTAQVTSLASVPGGAVAPQEAAPGAGEARDRAERAFRANNVGVAWLEQYNAEEAVEAFRRALEIDPRNVLANVNLAIALFYVPELEAAAAQARAALQLAPDAPQPHYILGLVARAENRVEDGVAAFGRVLEIDARDLGAQINLGQLFLQQRKYAEAVKLFRAAYETEPYNVTAAYNLGVALTRAGETGEGQQIMQRFQVLRESGYGTTFSNNYLEQGRYAEAVVSTGAEAALVDRSVPAVTFRAGPDLWRAPQAQGGGPATSAGATGIALADLDGSGALRVLVLLAREVAVVEQARGAAIASAPRRLPVGFTPTAVVVADANNDTRPDVFVAGERGCALFLQDADGAFADATAASRIPAFGGVARTAAFTDLDHDGDVDLVVAGVAGSDALAPIAPLVLRNDGNAVFEDVTTATGLAQPVAAVAIVPSDVDNRRDVDLLIASAAGPVLYRNQRDGTFRDASREVGLSDVGGATAVAAGDLNKDEFTDFFFARADADGVVAMSDGGGRFTIVPGPPRTQGAGRALFVDYDNDGLLDLVTVAAGRLRVARWLGGEWQDVAGTAGPADLPEGTGRGVVHGVAAGDLDADGDSDLVLWLAGAGAAPRVVPGVNQGGEAHASVRARLTGRVSNRSGIGAKVEVRAGGLRSRAELYAAWPAPAAADLVFGLGSRQGPDVVRILWPAGILQAELPEATEASRRLDLAVTELDRKPSSCPYLYTWNGERFEFLTDFLGGGEMGYWSAPGVRNTPDPDEFVRIPPGALRARDGRYELRVTNELEEALFLDRLELLAIVHPAGTEIHPHEGLTTPARTGLSVFVTHEAKPPQRVLDDRGRDVTDRAARLDRLFVDDLPVLPVRGYASPHTLTIETGAPADRRRVLLLLTGWTDYAFSSDNVAAHQAGHALTPPSLQVRDSTGEWRTVVEQVGIPVGRPQTVVVDLSGLFLSDHRDVRVVSGMRIYWDRILVDASGRAERIAGEDLLAGTHPGGVRAARLPLLGASLRVRGFSLETSPDGREPYTYDYARVSRTSPWKQMPGRYTRTGDVRPLLAAADDMFVVSAPGDEVALAFAAEPAAGHDAAGERTFLLHAVGYSKEMDLSSASPDQAWPLPFRGMTQYPYAWPETYPTTAAHRDYVARYNTRLVGRMVPLLELAAGLADRARPAEP